MDRYDKVQIAAVALAIFAVISANAGLPDRYYGLDKGLHTIIGCILFVVAIIIGFRAMRKKAEAEGKIILT